MRAQTNASTNQCQHKPMAAQTNANTNQYQHKPLPTQTNVSTNQCHLKLVPIRTKTTSINASANSSQNKLDLIPSLSTGKYHQQ
jgi:hypothetical protein